MIPPTDEAERLDVIRAAKAERDQARAALDAAEVKLDDAIIAARRGRPVTWQKIGAVLGLTHQAAYERAKTRRAATRRAS